MASTWAWARRRKPRILSSVSSVAKRDDVVDRSLNAVVESVLSIVTDEKADETEKSAAITKTFEQFEDYLKSNNISKADVANAAAGSTVDPNDTPRLLSPQLSDFTAAMITAEPTLTQEEATYRLLHTARGRKLGEHLSSILRF